MFDHYISLEIMPLLLHIHNGWKTYFKVQSQQEKVKYIFNLLRIILCFHKAENCVLIIAKKGRYMNHTRK